MSSPTSDNDILSVLGRANPDMGLLATMIRDVAELKADRRRDAEKIERVEKHVEKLEQKVDALSDKVDQRVDGLSGDVKSVQKTLDKMVAAEEARATAVPPGAMVITIRGAAAAIGIISGVTSILFLLARAIWTYYQHIPHTP